MKIGVPKEIKSHEYRVGLVPESVAQFVERGHEVFVEAGAGAGIGVADDKYKNAGAVVLSGPEEIFDAAVLIVKVKEPLTSERALLRSDHILFTYLHLAADAAQTSDLLKSGATCIAFETISDGAGGLPLLRPMSQVAGRLSIQAGATALENSTGGRGVLLGGVPGVRPGRVVIVGGGVVGYNAALMAVGLQANVTILDSNPVVLDRLATQFGGCAEVVHSSPAALAEAVAGADLVVGAVLIPGAAAPKIVSADMVSTMQPGAVLVDVAIDQGGCFETSRPTTHDAPTYMVDGVVHYCVANMPGAVARTSAYALNNVVVPHALAIADKGWRKALSDDPHLAKGLNLSSGKLLNRPVAESLGLDHSELDLVLRA